MLNIIEHNAFFVSYISVFTRVTYTVCIKLLVKALISMIDIIEMKIRFLWLVATFFPWQDHYIRKMRIPRPHLDSFRGHLKPKRESRSTYRPPPLFYALVRLSAVFVLRLPWARSSRSTHEISSGWICMRNYLIELD